MDRPKPVQADLAPYLKISLPVKFPCCPTRQKSTASRSGNPEDIFVMWNNHINRDRQPSPVQFLPDHTPPPPPPPPLEAIRQPLRRFTGARRRPRHVHQGAQPRRRPGRHHGRGHGRRRRAPPGPIPLLRLFTVSFPSERSGQLISFPF